MTATSEPLGIVAGLGQVPVEIATAARAAGRKVHVVAIGDDIEPGLADFPHTIVPWGAVGRLLATLRANGCRDLVIAGRVRRPDMFRIAPDWGFVRALPVVLRLFSGGDDSVLRRVVRFFEHAGFRVVGLADVAPHLLAGEDETSGIRPEAQDLVAIEAGFDVIAALGALDVGQAVVMSGRRAIAIEGAEGTDGMLARVDVRGRRAVLVKRTKPGQETRVDLPAVGTQTIIAAKAAGLAGVGLESGRVVMVDKSEMRRRAEDAGLFIASRPAILMQQPAEPPPARAMPPLVTATGRRPTRGQSQDVVLGRAAIAALRQWAASTGAVVVSGYVVALATDEPAVALIERAARNRAWGFTGRRGAAVVTVPPSIDIVTAAQKAGLAGVAFLNADREHLRSVIDQAAISRLFVLCATGGGEPQEPAVVPTTGVRDG